MVNDNLDDVNIVSSVTLNVLGTVTVSGPITITGPVDVNVLGGSVTVSGSVTVNGAVTITSGTVNIQTAAGITVEVGKQTYTPISRIISNDDNVLADTFDIKDENAGKYFPSGMRGFISEASIKVKNTTANPITFVVYFAPRIGAAAIQSTNVIVGGGGDGWFTLNPLFFWDYDGLFVWIGRTGIAGTYLYECSFTDNDDMFYNFPPSTEWFNGSSRAGIRIEIHTQSHYPVPVEGTVSIKNVDQTVTVSGTVSTEVTKWGGTALTGRDISLDLAYLDPCTSIGTLADVTAAAVATRLIVASTPCKSVVVKALAANTGNIRIGDANVTASRGDDLNAGDGITLAVSDVNLVYIFGNGTDKVSITYVN